ncbi:MAG: hypothetical protein C5B51_09195 [Terriglobia bacterium]|nr:MAG: hypothetical protein C5B51_09195 [Terriglobia bacterium]
MWKPVILYASTGEGGVSTLKTRTAVVLFPAAIALLLTAIPEQARAQNCQTGRLRIVAQDSSGAAVAGVNLRIAAESGAVLRAATDAQGVAEFDRLACGAWTLKAAKDGFHEITDSPFRVAGTSAATLDLILTSTTVRNSVEVHETTPELTQTSSPPEQLRPAEVKNLPFRPRTVADTLPLAPGVTLQENEVKIDGAGEHRAAFVVNQIDVTDPATGRFGQTIPIDSVESVAVLNSPFLAQYGNFTSGVVAVETRRGGEKWHAELNDPLPDFRWRSWHMRGIRDSTPRVLSSGPLIAQRLFFISALQYGIVKKPERTLGFPFNESKQESINSFTQLDYVVSGQQMLTGSLHFSPQHTNFVNPEYFNPQPVTPNYAQHNYVATVSDRLGVGQGTLTSTISVQRFDAGVGAQGDREMVLTPVGNRGNYFSTQRREAGRDQLVETWSPSQIERAGRHELKFGGSFTYLDNRGELTNRPINILDMTGLLLRRIEFTGGRPYRVTDSEAAAFAQDHWAIAPRLAFDFGARIVRQNISGTVRMAPRTGLSWAPFSSGRTVLRGGFGIFFDRVPLTVYTFGSLPQRIVTTYGPDGSAVGDPVTNVNVIGPGGAASPLVHSMRAPGSFAPHAGTWNIQLEQRVSSFFKLRAAFTDSRSAGLVVLEPQAVETDQLLLRGGGRSVFRQAELTGRFEWKSGQQMNLTYTRGRAQGSLNDFSGFLGNFPAPLIRQNLYSRFPADLPNRFLAWGRVNLPNGVQLLPMVEYRDGFPYARVNAVGDYVGTPFSSRFPSYLTADARILRDVMVNAKYTLRFAISGFNLTNHFNALSVHANTADPQYGIFFGNYRFRYRADFDVLF